MSTDDLLRAVAAFLIIILIFGRSTIRLLLDHREKRMELDARMTAERAAQYAAHTERLRDQPLN